MIEKKQESEQKAEQPAELSDQDVEQVSGGRAKAPTIYDQPGTKFE